MRFQKRIKILPGITLNLSKSGISTSFGVTGARYTIGNGKRRTTVGIPGTGLSHTTIHKRSISQETALSQLPEAMPRPLQNSDTDMVICPACHKKTLASENKCIRCNADIRTEYQPVNVPDKTIPSATGGLIQSFGQMSFAILKPVFVLIFFFTIGMLVAFFKMIFPSGKKRR